jgi:hypothetical protein
MLQYICGGGDSAKSVCQSVRRVAEMFIIMITSLSLVTDANDIRVHNHRSC